MAPGERTELDLWPYEEARRLAERVGSYPPEREVIFESGFGPSGLPHLGTMGEILRPAYVQHAFKVLGEADSQNAAFRRPSRLIVFIDDMDGLRKVPESIPNREATARFLGQPVSRIPDPFGDCHPSFAAHMIGLLGEFLEPVEVSYDLMRSSEMYASGRFDDALRLILAKHAEIIRIVTPTLREENRAGWSPVMPLCPACGQINSTLVTAYHPERATVEFSCERSFGGAQGCGFKGEQSVLGGKAKVQWKVDWALRWYVLNVDYELYGKDLIDSARLSGQILRLLGGRPPLGFAFEMYLDEEGHKVSKSIGRGVGVEQWRRYAPIEVLKYFLILNPRRARKLFLESIPQYTDEYLDALRAWSAADESARRNSPLEFVLQSQQRTAFQLDAQLRPRDEPGRGARHWRARAHLALPGALRSRDRGRPGDRAAHARPDGMCAQFLPRLYRAGQVSTTRRATASASNCARSARGSRKTARPAPRRSKKRSTNSVAQHYDKPGKIFPLLYRVLLGQERGPRLGAFIRLTTPARVAEIVDARLA